MKKRGKKLLAGAAALVMSCSMVTGWANGVEIVDVKVLNSATDEGTSFKNAEGVIENVKLNTEQMLQVTVKLTDGATENPAVAAGDVTFLSNIDGESVTLNNSTIQYVDQQTASTTDGTATITFRPRTTVGTAGVGSFVAKAGGTDVATTAEFNYTVEAPKVDMTVDELSKTITEGGSAVFKITPDSSVDISTVTVKENNDALESVTYADGTLTISGLQQGTHNLVISADGYNDKLVTVVVNSADVSVPDEEVEGVTGALGDELGKVTQGGTSVELPTTANGYDVAYSIPNEAPNKDKVTLTGNTLTLNDNVFAAKVTVNATVGTGGQITAAKDIYLVKDSSVNISFGNLDLISDSNGKDVFASSTDLEAAALTATQMTGIKAEALNYALDRRTPDTAINSAIDYDLNGDVTLSEYRMLKLMFEGAEGFGADDMVNARAGWINQAKGTAE